MMRRIIYIFFGLLILSHQIISAQQSELTNIVVNRNRDDLLIYLNVSGAFSEKIQKAVLSGVPVSFSFYIKLYRSRTYLFNKKIVDLKVTHTIKYDNLKQEFYVDRNWNSRGLVTTSSFEEARQLMVKIESLKIVSLQKLEQGKPYQLRAKAEVSKLTLPLHLHRVLFFLSFWDVETDWYSFDFTF